MTKWQKCNMQLVTMLTEQKILLKNYNKPMWFSARTIIAVFNSKYGEQQSSHQYTFDQLQKISKFHTFIIIPNKILISIKFCDKSFLNDRWCLYCKNLQIFSYLARVSFPNDLNEILILPFPQTYIYKTKHMHKFEKWTRAIQKHLLVTQISKCVW